MITINKTLLAGRISEVNTQTTPPYFVIETGYVSKDKKTFKNHHKVLVFGDMINKVPKVGENAYIEGRLAGKRFDKEYAGKPGSNYVTDIIASAILIEEVMTLKDEW